MAIKELSNIIFFCRVNGERQLLPAIVPFDPVLETVLLDSLLSSFINTATIIITKEENYPEVITCW